MRAADPSLRKALDATRIAATAVALPLLFIPIREVGGVPSAFECLWCWLSIVALSGGAIALWRLRGWRARVPTVAFTIAVAGVALWLLSRYGGAIYGARVSLFSGFHVLQTTLWIVVAAGTLEIARVARSEVPWPRLLRDGTVQRKTDPAAASRSLQLSVATLSALTLWVSLAATAPDPAVVPVGATFLAPFIGTETSYLGFEIVALAALLITSLWMRLRASNLRSLDDAPTPQALGDRCLDLLLRTGLPLVGVGALAWKALPRPEGVALAVFWSIFAIALVLREKRFRIAPPPRWRRFARGMALFGLGAVGVLAVLEGFDLRIPLLGVRAIYRPVSAGQAELARTDLRGRVFQLANFERANLDEADFEGSDLWGARLDGARLRNASLVDARLVRAELRRADLRGAQLDNSDFSRGVLFEADLRDVEGHWSRWKDANLSGADLRGADLQQSTWDLARIYGADFGGADLRGARFDATQLRDSSFRFADLRNAVMSHANLRRADLEGADLRGASLASVRFQGANLRGADLRTTVELDPRTIRATCFDASTQFPFDVSELLASREAFCRPFTTAPTKRRGFISPAQ